MPGALEESGRLPVHRAHDLEGRRRLRLRVGAQKRLQALDDALGRGPARSGHGVIKCATSLGVEPSPGAGNP